MLFPNFPTDSKTINIWQHNIKYRKLKLARVDRIDVDRLFKRPSIRGNMSMGFWMFFRKVSVRGNISTYISNSPIFNIHWYYFYFNFWYS